MLTVIFRMVDESERNTLVVPNEDSLLNVCYVFERSIDIKEYTIIDPENSEPGVETVAVFSWSSASFPKFKPFLEF